MEAQTQIQFRKSDGRTNTATFKSLDPTQFTTLTDAKKFAQLLLPIKNAASIVTYSRYVGEKAEYSD